MNETAIVVFSGKLITVKTGTRISELPGMPLPCGGHGKCGKCKVKAHGALSALSEAEKNALTQKEITEGIRLACRTRILGDAMVELPENKADDLVLTGGKTSHGVGDIGFSGLGVALDIGTTTLAARLFDKKGALLSEAGALNPQTAFGADVISRIEAALAGKENELAAAVISGIDALVDTLCREAGKDPALIGGAVVTGNTAMLHLLTKTSTSPLSRAPFLMERGFGETLGAREIGFSSFDAPVYLAPCISAFVGADTVCAILATELDTREGEMLADIGTNGEMALYHDGKLTVCSTAAGPAFEGVGISQGMRGKIGAIDRVTLEDGKLRAHVIGGGKPKGVCGSGLVDAIACLLDNETIDETGYLEDDEVTIKSPVTLTKQDVRMVQLAKSAIASGLQTLLHHAGITSHGVPRLAVAGGFGSYLDKGSAARIGLLPRELAEKSEAVGNAALDGAAMLLLDRALRQKAERIAKDAQTLDLSTDPYFSETYMEGMLFPEE